MNDQELKALETARDEIIKIRNRYQKKALVEREKVNDVFITVCGEKCHTEAEINEWYACDYITCDQADKYIEELKKKKSAAGQQDLLTKSERIYRVLENLSNGLTIEIKDIKIRQEQERKRQERWKIAQMQGCSYKEFLEIEEVSRQSEEYEKLMGI